jgi:hypothetical protein
MIKKNYIYKYIYILLFLFFILYLLSLIGKEHFIHNEKVIKSKFDTDLQNDTSKWGDLSMEYIVDGHINEEKVFSKKNMDHLIQKENLLLLNDFFKKKNIKYYIDCGTLLGAIRENNFIKGDTDVDIMVSEQGFYILRQNLKELENIGFISFRNADGGGWMGMSLLRNGEYIDIYKTDEIKFELILYYFLDSYFYVPKYYKEYLSEEYGEWMIPVDGGKGTGNWELGMPNYKKKYSSSM